MSQKRAIVIGLDGMPPDLVRPLVDQGIMPTLQRFQSGGLLTTLESIIPPFTGPSWTSLTTGVNPGKHGMYAFVMPDRARRPKLMSSYDVGYPRIHEMLALWGMRSVIINLPLSYPPRLLQGLIISDWLHPELLVIPRSLAGIAQGYVMPQPPSLTSKGRDWARFLRDTTARVTCLKRIFKGLDWDLFFVVFSETDWLMHLIYDNMLGGEMPDEVVSTLQTIDGFVRWVLDEMSSGSLLLLVSDHGFKKYRGFVHPNVALNSAGLARFALGSRDRSFMRSFGEHFQWRGWMAPPVPIQIQTILFHSEIARKLASKFVSKVLRLRRRWIPRVGWVVDPSSQAFMLDSQHVGIYLNSREVFDDGNMEPVDEQVQARIVELLATLRSPSDGKRVIKKIYHRDELFQGPYTRMFPHLILETSDDYVANNSILPKQPVSGLSHFDHSMLGILGAIGRDVDADGALARPSVLDITPTLLAYLGLPVPTDTDGQVLTSLLGHRVDLRNSDFDYLKEWRAIVKLRQVPAQIR